MIPKFNTVAYSGKYSDAPRNTKFSPQVREFVVRPHNKYLPTPQDHMDRTPLTKPNRFWPQCPHFDAYQKPLRHGKSVIGTSTTKLDRTYTERDFQNSVRPNLGFSGMKQITVSNK